MNDTHGETGKGWYGFDLDGTLAKYDGWKGIDHIGEPVKPMVDLIKRMHDEGKVVKILTARVAPRSNPETVKTRYPLYAGEDIGDVPEYAARWMNAMRKVGNLNDQVEACRFYFKEEWTARDFIADWCLEHLGFLPEITHEKDHLMLELYDDRVKQVVPNEGVLVEDLYLIEDLYMECGEMPKEVHSDNGWLLAKLRLKFIGFLAGLWIGAALAVLTFAGVKAYDKWLGRGNEPARVRLENAHKALNDLLNDWPEGVR